MKTVLILILTFFSAFLPHSSFCQEEMVINHVAEEVRYESLLEYELDFENSKQYLTEEQRFNSHKELSHYFKEKGDYSRALRHGLEALNYAQKQDDLLMQGEMHLNVSGIHLDIQNAEESIKSSNAAISIYQDMGDSTALIRAYNSLGNAYLSSGKFSKAKVIYSRSLGLANAIDNPELAMVPISNLGAYYLFSGEADSAMEFIDQALAFDRYSRNPENLAIAFGNKAYAYTLKEDYKLANAYFDSSFVLAKENNLKIVLLNLYKDRSDMYYSLGDYKQSFDDLVEHQQIMDSLKSSVSSEQISDWKVSYANEERKREIIQEQAKFERLQHEKEIESITNLFIISILFFVLLLLGALFWRFRTKSIKKKELLEKDLELERLTTRLKQMALSDEDELGEQ